MRKYVIVYGKKDKWGLAKSAIVPAKNKDEAIANFRKSTKHQRKRVHGIAVYKGR